MDRARYSFIAHAECDICNPIGEGKTDRAIGLAAELGGLGPGSHVVDIGAGKGEWLLRFVAQGAVRGGVRGTAIEPAGLFAAEIRRRAAERGVADRVSVAEEDAKAFFARTAGEVVDVALCVGSSHALGDVDGALAVMHRVVRPGGVVVLGAGYWRKTPEREYLESFGGSSDEMGTHEENVAKLMAAGFTPMWATTASEDEFEEYEWAYSRGIERHVLAHPQDPDAAAMLERSRGWRRSFLRWGRETMGFGLYVAMRG